MNQNKNYWIKEYTKIFDNPIVTKSTEHFTIWNYLLTHATAKQYRATFMGKEIVLKPGQLITGRKTISKCVNSSISESKVQRVLKDFENAHQIEQQTCNKNRLITLINWNKYQRSEQQTEQQVNNKRTTTEQQVNTNKKEKKDKKDKNSFTRARAREKKNSLFNSEGASFDKDDYDKKSLFND